MHLSDNIRYLRKKAGLSQEDVAKKFGYENYTTVQKWESGKSDPPVKIIKGLSELFGVSLDDIVKEDLQIKEGISAIPLSKQEEILLSDFRQLSQSGKDAILKRTDELLKLEGKRGLTSSEDIAL